MRTPRPWTLPTQPVTSAILRAGHVTREMVETQLASGRLLRLRHGVYLAADSWPDTAAHQHLVLAHAEQVANPGAVLSHQSAAVAWGLPSPGFRGWHEEPVCVTFPSGAGHQSRQRNAVHRVAALPVEHITRDPAGYPVTSIARTAVDLARVRSLPEALVVLDAAARLLVGSYVTEPRRQDYASARLAGATREELSSAAGDPVGGPLAEAIQACDPRRESPAESLSAGHFMLAGLPTPEYQVRLVTPSGVYFADFYWRHRRLIGECDGALKYTDASSVVAEKHREQSLRDEDHDIVRWLGGEIMARPATVVARVERALS